MLWRCAVLQPFLQSMPRDITQVKHHGSWEIRLLPHRLGFAIFKVSAGATRTPGATRDCIKGVWKK